MKYEIRVDYRTGDSFNTYDSHVVIPGDWGDIEVVKENLRRIKGHHEWYESNTSTWRSSPKKIEQPSYVVDTYSIRLKLDNGTEYQYFTDWTGYFETLYSATAIAKIEPNLNSDDEIESTLSFDLHNRY
jgi:hypothetical protein